MTSRAAGRRLRVASHPAALWGQTDGITYLRTARGAYPVLYASGEQFQAGGSKILRSDPADAVTLIGAGVTLHECLLAADPLVAAADATAGRLVVAEDHHPAGGRGSAAAAALLEAGIRQVCQAHLSASELPGSGTTTELLNAAGIDAAHIAAAAAILVDQR